MSSQIKNSDEEETETNIVKPSHRPCRSMSSMRKNGSKPHQELLELIKPYITDEDVLYQDRTVLRRKELDVVLQKRKMALEFNGIFWHSEPILKSRGVNPEIYHLSKTNMCDKAGYHLLHIYEHDWYNRKDLIMHRLIFQLGKSEVYYARKCLLREVSMSEASFFLDEYHMQGNIESLVRLGLYYNNELVAIMTFGKSKDSRYEWELQRFCSRGRVHGGASRLYKHFLKTYNPKSVVSYADRRWSTGFVFYSVLGLELTNTLPPEYFFVYRIYGRLNFTEAHFNEHDAKKVLEDRYDPQLSDAENLSRAGYFKLYDCGAYEFSKVYH